MSVQTVTSPVTSYTLTTRKEWGNTSQQVVLSGGGTQGEDLSHPIPISKGEHFIPKIDVAAGATTLFYAQATIGFIRA